jgi:hypothetical protein
MTVLNVSFLPVELTLIMIFLDPMLCYLIQKNRLTGSRTGLGGGDIFSLREYPVLCRRVASGAAWGEGAGRKITTEGWH